MPFFIFEFKFEGKPEDAILQIKSADHADKYMAKEKKYLDLIRAAISKDKRTLDNCQIEKIREVKLKI